MYKRTRRLRNKCGDTRTLKLINEGNIMSMSCNECDIDIGISKEEYITGVKFSCGPDVIIGSYITLSDFGKCKIIGIYPSLSNNPNEFLFEILKTEDGKRRKK
jgi:hypothetical protein